MKRTLSVAKGLALLSLGALTFSAKAQGHDRDTD